MTVFWEILAALCLVGGAFIVLTGAVVFFKERDALTRLNGFGPAASLGMPLITVGAYIGWTLNEGWDALLTLKSLIALLAFVMVSAVGTNVLARASYMSGAKLDPETFPNDLAEDPNAPAVSEDED